MDSINILYNDDHIVVVDKPAGVYAHPVGGVLTGTLIDILRASYGQEVRLVHRLDKDTSGLLVASKTESACKALYRQFESRKVKKVYLAVVRGTPYPPVGEINLPIGRDQDSLIQIKMRVDPCGFPSISRYRIILELDKISLLEITPDTGRKHQIRVHLASWGHPIIGDRIYEYAGLPFLWEYYLKRPFPWKEGKALNRHALHSAELEFSHPVTNESLSFKSSLPSDIEDIISCFARIGNQNIIRQTPLSFSPDSKQQ